MKRLEILGIFLTLLFSAVASTTVAETSTPPLPVDTSWICSGETVYDTFAVSIDDPSDTSITLELITGPGTLTWGAADQFQGYYEFMPLADTTFLMEYLVRYSTGDSVMYTRKYVVYVNHAPTIEDQYSAFRMCSDNQDRLLDVDASDPDNPDICV